MNLQVVAFAAVFLGQSEIDADALMACDVDSRCRAGNGQVCFSPLAIDSSMTSSRKFSDFSRGSLVSLAMIRLFLPILAAGRPFEQLLHATSIFAACPGPCRRDGRRIGAPTPYRRGGMAVERAPCGRTPSVVRKKFSRGRTRGRRAAACSLQRVLHKERMDAVADEAFVERKSPAAADGTHNSPMQGVSHEWPKLRSRWAVSSAPAMMSKSRRRR